MILPLETYPIHLAETASLTLGTTMHHNVEVIPVACEYDKGPGDFPRAYDRRGGEELTCDRPKGIKVLGKK